MTELRVLFPEKNSGLETSTPLVKDTARFVREQLEGQGAGHDWFHVERVWATAKHIAKLEGGVDNELVEITALLHDIADYKFHDGDEEIGPKIASDWLRSQGQSEERIATVADTIKKMSFKGAGVETPMSTREGMIVQDADRLDALGAIGIARTFEYGGHKGRVAYDPDIKPEPHLTPEEYKSRQGPTINHFYEKLLLLKDRMNTDTAKKIAEERHAFMEEFLDRFFEEWQGNR